MSRNEFIAWRYKKTTGEEIELDDDEQPVQA